MKVKSKVFGKKEIFNDALKFTKENKGFMLALILFLVSILFLQLFLTQNISEEKLAYVKDMHTNNQLEIDSYLSSVDELLVEEKEDALDNYFLDSTKKDFIWLKEKEQQLFTSRPGNDLYAKEAAFSVFLLKIVELNEAFDIRIGDVQFDSVINQALSEQITVPFIFSQEKVVELFEGNVREANIFSNTLNYLFEDYIIWKKKMIEEDSMTESRYVEAKKLLLVSDLDGYVE